MDSHPFLSKGRVKEVVENIEHENGTKIKDFNTKEIVIIFHKETQKKIEKLDNKIDEHIKWGEKQNNHISKVLNDHDILFERLMLALPEKGFCEKVTNVLQLDKKLTIADKIELLWNDRRWLKGVLVAILLIFGGDFAIRFFGG
jgi:hypothetical protein